ncbi:hypothetical protein [Gymnodinialimonas ulvae]|uniref:hypothetical protein n=1 Tax=Gymnodinialimonas ulvae TaxID=3126504 RepID=UPI0030AAB92A
MDQAILFTGFATMAGVLAGYIAARIGRKSHVMALWGIAALAVILYPIWLDRGVGSKIPGAPTVLYFGLIPFAMGVLAGSVSGAVMRAVFARGDRT